MPNHKRKKNTNFKHGMFGTRFYRIWSSMIQRTNNHKRGDYHKYGGRGIKVCENWKTFTDFMNDMYASYQLHIKKHGEKETQLDRVESAGNYEPSNCRWVTLSEQRRNTSRMVYYEYNGVKLCLTDWMLILGVPKITLWDGLNKHKKTIKDFFETKFGSPQKESGDLEKVLEEFDKIHAEGFYKYSDLKDVKSFIRSHWPKPDPRFVEVGKIIWPDELECSRHGYKTIMGCPECGSAYAINETIKACKAAALKAGEKEASRE